MSIKKKVVLKNSNVELNLGKSNVDLNADEYIKEYYIDNFNIKINNKFSSKKLKFIKKEITEGALWLYFSYQLSGKIEKLEVENKLLNDYYPDMTNLVILKYNDLESGYSLNKTKTTFKISS